jgi:FAD/FMN-containing dehydrogenase
VTTTDQPGLTRPGQPGYDEATRVFNLATPARPALAATVRSVTEVRAALNHAAAADLRVHVMGTGHGAANARPMDGALLIRTRLDGGVRVDPDTAIARVPAGTTWGEVVEAAAPHGLAAPHGSSPLVGVVGYLLRGGVSFYGRHVGIAANSVRAVELVTADGEWRRVDASGDAELFRALRGGGGGFGVVTAVEVALFPARTVATGAVYWPNAHAEQLVDRWLRWTRDAPGTATTTLRLMNLPPLPIIPEPLRAGTVLCVDGAVLADHDDPATASARAEELLGPLRAVAEPLLDTWRQATPPDVLGTHMDPTEPFPIFGDHLLLDDLPGPAVEEFLRQVGAEADATLTNAELRQLGGALAVPDPAGGVLDHLDARFAYMGGGVPFGDVTPAAIVERCAAVRAALAPWSSGRTAPSFVENLGQPQGHLDADQVAAVDRVRARVDPHGRFADDIAPNASSRY